MLFILQAFFLHLSVPFVTKALSKGNTRSFSRACESWSKKVLRYFLCKVIAETNLYCHHISVACTWYFLVMYDIKYWYGNTVFVMGLLLQFWV